jgi:cobalt-precorrin-5B (C1)-methyltransferase
MAAEHRTRKALRVGFSTGTAAVAAARAALRWWLTGRRPAAVAVRLPAGYYLSVAVAGGGQGEGETWAGVVKDGGDDPDVTHHAEIRARLRCLPCGGEALGRASGAFGETLAGLAHGRRPAGDPLICLVGGRGVGRVTKPGLPVAVGEPAVNPGPREMMTVNLREELRRPGGSEPPDLHSRKPWSPPQAPHILLGGLGESGAAPAWVLEVEIEVIQGEVLARHTLNPRLGVVGGISILGTTGLVRPFSHEAYEETIQAELSVARSNGCRTVVLSTGGKSEHLAQRQFPDWPPEAFVQIADFFAFSLREARRAGFGSVVHSVFFGKAVKMAQGHEYTHAHRNRMDLGSLAALCREGSHPDALCREIEEANTARHALEILLREEAMDLVRAVAEEAAEASWRMAEQAMRVRLLLFNHDGRLLADVSRP